MNEENKKRGGNREGTGIREGGGGMIENKKVGKSRRKIRKQRRNMRRKR